MKQQSVERALYDPNYQQRAGMYPELVADAKYSTPDMRNAITANGIADIAQGVLKTAEFITGVRAKLQEQAVKDSDNNALMKVQTLFQTHKSGFQPDFDTENGKRKIDGIMERMQSELDKLPGVSVHTREKLRNYLNTGREELELEQEYGRMKLIQGEKHRYIRSGVEQSVQSGSMEKLEEYLNSAKSEHLPLAKTPEQYRSETIMYGRVVNQIQNLGLHDLQAQKEILDEVDKEGNASAPALKGMRRDEVMQARRHVQARINDLAVKSEDTLLRSYLDGKLSPGDLQQQYASGQLYLGVYNNFRARLERDFAHAAEAKNKADHEAMKNTADKISFDVYNQEWAADPVKRGEQYQQLHTRIMSAPIDPGKMVTLLRSLDEGRKSYEKPDNSYRSENTYKMGEKIVDQYYKDSKMYSDPDGLGNKKQDADFQQSRYVELLDIWDDFYKNNRDKLTPEATQNFLKNKMVELNEGRIRQSFYEAYKRNARPAGGMLNQSLTKGGK